MRNVSGTAKQYLTTHTFVLYRASNSIHNSSHQNVLDYLATYQSCPVTDWLFGITEE